MVRETGDAALAWRALRYAPDYREAWLRHGGGAPLALEPGPFGIRVQSEADREAERFELLAWEDPHDANGPVLPFWRQEGMIEGLVESGAPPLVKVVANGGAVEGLRLLGGDLVLKVEYAGEAVQIRVRDAPRFPDGGALAVKHVFGLEMPVSMQRVLDFWSVAGRKGPRKGWARRANGSGTACRRP